MQLNKLIWFEVTDPQQLIIYKTYNTYDRIDWPLIAITIICGSNIVYVKHLIWNTRMLETEEVDDDFFTPVAG